MRVLILGGASEANRLARALAPEQEIEAVLSLAGRTKHPAPAAIAQRVGGFGGASGLLEYLRRNAIDVVIDATHPFAERISANAESACREAGVPLALFTRAPWRPEPGDLWREVADAAEAARALGETPRRVFLTIGRLQIPAFEIAPRHDYLIRCIDPPEPPPNLPRHRLILARGPFAVEDEVALMRAERIEVLVTKNSGGDATRAKLDAARLLGLEVILMRPPTRGAAIAFHDLAETLAFVRSHRRVP